MLYGYYYSSIFFQRTEQKNYGLNNLIEGEFTKNQKVVLIEDVITTGSSIFESAKNLEDNGYMDWLKDAENEDFVRMVGLLQLVQETFSALQEELREDD